MKTFIRILISGRFWINLCLICLTLVGLTVIVLWWLETYTQHGESVSVPNLVGYNLADVQTIAHNTDLSFEVTDSIYSDEVARGVVVLQNPIPNKKVKQGRTVFLTMNSTFPEMVKLPDLMGKSRRIALPLLEISGIKVAALEYKPDDSCTDCVVGSTFEGKPIKAGDKIRKGDEVVLILGRESNIKTTVPDIVGLSYRNASEIIYTQSLNIGEILECKGCISADDSTNAIVIRQLPSRGNETTLGAFVDVFLSTDSTDLPSSYKPFNDSLDVEMD